jgi:mycofactocin system creatininase family protein
LQGWTLRLAELAWPEVGTRGPDPILAVPLGSTEQHGPHLPLSTDTDVADALCVRLAAARAEVLVAPCVAYGSSGEHAGFPGTLSIGQDALELLVVELVRSATETFPHVVLVSGHGGNSAPVARAVARLRGEGRDVLAFAPKWDGDAHAGRVETSLQLALQPELVGADRSPGDTRPLSELLPLLRAGGVRSIVANGILGDPTGATADEGAALLDTLAADLVAKVAAWLA